MKKLSALIFILFSINIAAQQLPPLRERANSVGVQKSALCWISTVYIQGAMSANPSVPNAAATAEFARDLQGIYNSYGDVLVGQNTFNQLVRNAGDYFKSQSEPKKIEIWRMCQEAWKG